MKLAQKIEVGNHSENREADRRIHQLISGIKSFSKYVGLAISLIGLLVLSGWLLGIEQLKSAFAGLPAMNANTAIAFITAGLSVWLRGSTSSKIQTAAQVLGVITGLIGFLTLGEYISGRNFGIDELIFKDLAASGGLYPGRMSFMSALNFTMMGMALLLFDSDDERRYNLAQSLALVAGIIAYIALAGHLFDVESLYRVGVFAPMAFHTALSFILLFVGMVCAQPEGGWVGHVIADTLGGDLLRRLLPVAFVVPILLGWLRLQGQLAGYYDTPFGTTLLAVAITLFLSVIIWFNAKGLTRVDMDRRQAEQELRQSEERFRSIVNQTLGGIVEIDLAGTFLTVNERVLEITGYTREELLGGMRTQDITHPDDLPRTLELLQECLEHGTPFEIEKRYIRKDGSFVWVSNSVSAINGADGKPRSFVAVVIDITKRKLAEEWEESSTANLLAAAEANAKFRTFFDQGSYFAGVMNLDGTVVEANRLSLEAGGFRREDVIGRKFWDCGWWNPSPALMEMVRNGTRDAIQGKLFRQESKYFLADGSERFVDLIIAPVKDDQGRLLFLAPTGTDITERKRTEQALIEFAQQQEALYKLTDQLQRTDSLEDIFNAALDAILGALQCDRASILLFDDTDVMRFVAWRGLSDGYREATDGHSPWKPGEKEPEPIYFNDIGTAEVNDSLGAVIKEEGIGSLAFIPLVANERLIGKFMTYFNAPHIFSEGELELSLTIARQLAFGVDRKRAEEALRRNEQMFSTLVDAAPFGVYFIDSEFRLRAINKGSEHVFSGIHPLIGRDFAEIIRIIWQEPFATEAIERFRQTLRTGESFISTPIIEQRANIEEIEAYDWQIHRITLSDGTYGVVCYFYDLSEQKRMEATVRASEELYRTIARSIPGGGVYIVDKEFRYIVAEGSVSEAFGVSREMLEGHTVSDVFPQEMSTRMEDRLRRNFAGETINYETEHDGRVYWTQQAPLLDSLGQAIVVTLDITERKRAETELVESERRFREMIDALPAAIYTTDAEGLLTHFNPAAAEFSGRVPELGTDRWCVTLKLYHPDGTPLPHDQCPMAIALKEGRVVRGAQAIAERPDGRRIWFEPYPTPLRDSTGRIVGGINMLVDITERKQAEEALRHLNLQLESQVQSRTAKLRAVNQSLREEIAERKRVEEQLIYQALLISNVNDAIIATDGNLVVTYWNPTAEQIYGWSAEEVMGRLVSDILQTEFIDGNTYSGSLQKVNELHELRTSVTHLRKDGSRIFVEAHTSTLLNEDGRVTGYVSINHDITERKKAEQELRLNRDRLRSLSQRLVEVQEEERRAIANELHDRVGQSLSALNINLTIMRDQLSADALQRIGPRMNDSMQLAAEAITLVRDVMSDLRPAVLDDYGLEAALRSYVDQFKSRYGIKILFEKPAQPILRMSPSFEMTFLRIAQEALLNIARHARADQINLSLWQDQHAIRLVVQDNGTGIQSWQEANRPGSHGLTIMRERADAVGGSLRVQSVPGKGTKVEVSIPSENVSPQTVQKERPA